MTEFSLLVHVSTHLQHEEAFPSTCARSLPAGAFLGSSVAWQGSCERRLHAGSGRLPGPQRAPSPWGDRGSAEKRGIRGQVVSSEEGDDDKGRIRAGGEQTVHIITPSAGMEREGAEKRSDNNEKLRRIEWRCSEG